MRNQYEILPLSGMISFGVQIMVELWIFNDRL